MICLEALEKEQYSEVLPDQDQRKMEAQGEESQVGAGFPSDVLAHFRGDGQEAERPCNRTPWVVGHGMETLVCQVGKGT